MILLGYRIVDASSMPAAIRLSSTGIKSIDSLVVPEVQVGQQYLIMVTISHNYDYKTEVPFVAFIEVRDPYGVTQSSAFQSGKLNEQIDDHTEIVTSWMPANSGQFSVRMFAVSDMENPLILSVVSESIVNVKAYCNGHAECLLGHVIRIVDGDTLDLDEIRIRLALLNTPEVGEPGYDEAKEFATRLCQPPSFATADEDDGQTEVALAG
jgi:hypothetical protein